MSDNGFDLGSISLDESGRVVLQDDQLAALAADYRFTVSAGDGQTNSNSCSNQSSCRNTMNGSCSNQSGQCGGSTNLACRTTYDDTIE